MNKILKRIRTMNGPDLCDASEAINRRVAAPSGDQDGH